MKIQIDEHKEDKYSSLTDDDLIALAKQKDYDAFDCFHHRYLKKILNYINRMINDFQKAEEITQETFIQVYKHLDSYVPLGKVSSWIFKIASNLTKNEIRSTKRIDALSVSLHNKIISGDHEMELIDITPDRKIKPDDNAEKSELACLIEQAINSLPLKYREVMLICEVNGYSYKEAGEILNCSKANIGIRLCRARRMMKNIIERRRLKLYNSMKLNI